MSSTITKSNPRTSPLIVPVLISGAGPTGLFAAILPTELGHPCRIIERHLEISPLSKALVIHTRTMEMFAMTGILDRFTSQGAHLSDIHAYFGSKLTSVLPALRGTESEYSYGLFLEQLRTTAILVEELEKIGGHVDRGWEQMDIKVVTDLGVPEARPAPHGDRLAGRTRGRGGAVFGDVMDLLGALTACLLVFVMPVMFYYRLGGLEKKSWATRAWAVVILLVGAVALVLGTLDAVRHLAADFRRRWRTL